MAAQVTGHSVGLDVFRDLLIWQANMKRLTRQGISGVQSPPALNGCSVMLLSLALTCP
jgi:hypothetical protein